MLKLLHITDLHWLAEADVELWGWRTQASAKAVLSAALSECEADQQLPDAVIITGDLVDDESRHGYTQLCQWLQPYNIPVLLTPGNHDDEPLLNAVVAEQNSDTLQVCGRLPLANWQVLGLSTHMPGEFAGALSAESLRWLRQTLEQHQQPTLVALHHPPVPVMSPWLDQISLRNPEDFWQAIAGFAHVKGVLCGHVHQDFFTTRQSVPVWTSPSTWRQFPVSASTHTTEQLAPGWRWLWLQDNGDIATTVRRLAHVDSALCPSGIEGTAPCPASNDEQIVAATNHCA